MEQSARHSSQFASLLNLLLISCVILVFVSTTKNAHAQASLYQAHYQTDEQFDDSVIVETDSLAKYKAWTESETAERKSQSPTAALFKSLLIPGGGQLGNRKYLKAGIVIALEGTLLWRWRHFRNETVAARDLLESEPAGSANLFGLHADFEAVRNDRNLFAWLAGTAIFLSMIDAFVDAHLAEFPNADDVDLPGKEDDSNSLSLQIAPLGVQSFFGSQFEHAPSVILTYNF